MGFLESLPEPRAYRRTRKGGAYAEIDVCLRVVTPIVGGAPKPRTVDTVDGIRAPTIRGHLRFWWRALYGHRWPDPGELYAHESELWGRAGEAHGGRSKVELLLTEVSLPEARSFEWPRKTGDTDDVVKAATAFTMWPLRPDREGKQPPGQFRPAGGQFRLIVRVPAVWEDDVRRVLTAWILFGGYGGRTRRGLGALTVVDGDARLPGAPVLAAIHDALGTAVFSEVAGYVGDVALLAGASLLVGASSVTVDAREAWGHAVCALRDFRQGTTSPIAGSAPPRQPVPQDPSRPSCSNAITSLTSSGASFVPHDPSRPSRSNWPEPDKIRHLSRLRQTNEWAHKPKYNAQPAWPRAQLGLPIIGRFQEFSREPRPEQPPTDKGVKWLKWTELDPPREEPGDYQIIWTTEEDGELVRHDRLASPLIVKPLPLTNGRFVPMALWLNRGFPAGQVALALGKRKSAPPIRRSRAPFQRLLAPGDSSSFFAVNRPDLRTAYCEWLRALGWEELTR